MTKKSKIQSYREIIGKGKYSLEKSIFNKIEANPNALTKYLRKKYKKR